MISPGKHSEGKEEVYKRNMEKSEKKETYSFSKEATYHFVTWHRGEVRLKCGQHKENRNGAASERCQNERPANANVNVISELQQRILPIMFSAPKPCIHLVKSHQFKYFIVNLYLIWSTTAAEDFFFFFYNLAYSNIRIHAPSIVVVRSILVFRCVNIIKVLEICL